MVRLPVALLAVLPLFHVLLACGDDPGQEPVLVLGGGESAFEPAHDGDALPLVAGSQGGYHLWLSMRVAGLSPARVRMTLDVTPAAPAPPAHSEVELDLSPSKDAALPLEFVGWPARVLMPECAVGKPVDFRVALRDRQGRSASAQITLEAGEPRLPFSAACQP